MTARILIVDDDVELLDALREVLLDAGYDVLHAADGTAALGLLADGPLPSLALLDLMMPGMDGLQLRAALRADPRLRAIPVVFLSASRPPVNNETPFLQKPIRVDVLLGAIERHLAPNPE
jgi:two-component system alkaline phosphatase synthesis response regulator PhoP